MLVRNVKKQGLIGIGITENIKKIFDITETFTIFVVYLIRNRKTKEKMRNNIWHINHSSNRPSTMKWELMSSFES
jgi:hypothetical protein